MNRRTFLTLVAALPAAMQTSTWAADQKPEDYLKELVTKGIAPGAALIVSRKGKVTFKKVTGTFCEIGNRNASLTLNTIHPLYSFSKLVTGTVVAMAVSEGRLNYGDLVSRYIPKFTGGGKDPITIRHCLTHAAGLAKVELKPVHETGGWDDALDRLCNAEVEWVPGSQCAYHGWSGAFLAAECVRRCYGEISWAKLCHEKLFLPLGAKSLSFELPATDADVAITPQPAADKPVPQKVEVAFGYAGHPGAGCFGTLEDALKVLHFHLKHGVFRGKRFISEEVFKEMHTVQFAKEIQAAREAGKTPAHEPWGLGPLLRGDGPACEAHKWFGFANQTSPQIFGHAGINTLIGVADLNSQIALMFVTTNSPKTSEETVRVRNAITDLVFA